MGNASFTKESLRLSSLEELVDPPNPTIPLPQLDWLWEPTDWRFEEAWGWDIRHRVVDYEDGHVTYFPKRGQLWT